jgi:protein with PEP-CTERM/exosortase system signal
MKNRIPILVGAVCAFLLVLGSTVRADLDFGDGRDLGFIHDGIPSGDQDRTDYVNHLIGMGLNTTDSFQGQDFTRYNTSCGSCTPVNVLDIQNGAPKVATVDLGSGGFLYLFAKYDGPNAGSEVWNIQGLTGVFTIPAFGTPDKNNKYGLSGWSIWKGGETNTPDSGTAAALLGLGLTGLAALRARFGRK